MAILGIKGHPTRGGEVIQLLEMMGGVNVFNLGGAEIAGFYYSCTDNNKIYHCWTKDENAIVYTLEEFLEKFPYKAGDKVNFPCKECIRTILSMEWDIHRNTVTYKFDNWTYTNIDQLKVVNDLQSYKEEDMEEPKELIVGFTKDDNGDFILDIHKDYEIKEIEGKLKVIKKQPQYPKYYFECCEVLGLGIMENYGSGYKRELIINLQKLLICRDAYWKIAGEQMGLDKPWEPDWSDTSQSKHSIWFNNEGICIKSNRFSYAIQHILTFPTSEMRNSFYENFKYLINECKELI